MIHKIILPLQRIMQILIKNKVKKNLKNILKYLTKNETRKTLINLLIEITDGHYFDELELEGLNEKEEYKEIYIKSLLKAGDENTNNIYKILRHLSLYNYIEDVIKRKIEGDFAECGCWNGNSLFATKFLIDKHSLNKSFHIFDSFEGGLSEFREKDMQNSSIKSKLEAEEIKKQFSSSYEELLKKTNGLKMLEINKGWIPEILEKQEERNYCFVHIDVDLYEPTISSHKYFFERLSKGGIIVCDDYGYRQFPGAKLAVDEFISSLPKSSYSHIFKPSIGTSVLIK